MADYFIEENELTKQMFDLDERKFIWRTGVAFLNCC